MKNCCNICGNEYLNLKEFTGENKINLCENCLSHILQGGRFIKIPLKAVNNPQFSERLMSSINDWLAYKTSRKDKYTDKGWQSLMTRIENEVKATSEEVVISKIKNSIEKKYQGICWDDNSYMKEDIIKMFDMTFCISPNKANRESAKRQYLYIFRGIEDIEKAKEYGRKIYRVFKNYVDSLDDIKWCMNFENFLKKNIPSE